MLRSYCADMASLIKSGGRYYLQFYNSNRQPNRKKVPLKTGKKRPAQSKRRELEDAYVEGRFDPWQDDPFSYDLPDVEHLRISEALERFIDDKRELGRAEKTISHYEWVVERFKDFVGSDVYLRDVSTRQLSTHVYDPSVGASTQSNLYRHLRSFFRWCEGCSYLEDNPMEQVEAPDPARKVPKNVTRRELLRICSKIREEYDERIETANGKNGGLREGFLIWHIPLFWFALYTAMRVSELGRLRWKHIDFRSDTIHVEEQKNNEEDYIPLYGKARAILEEVEKGEPDHFVFLAPNSDPVQRKVEPWRRNVSRTFSEYREKAGIDRKITFHGLRHAFCSMLAEHGASAATIKEAARHKTIETSMRYVHLSKKRLKDQVDDVF